MSDPSAPASSTKLGCLPIALGLGAIVIVLGLWAAGSYNTLVARDEKVNAAWSQVETVLQRRYDLIPNLVATVKGYAQHEKELLENVTRLRSQWGAAKQVEEKAQAASELESAVARLLVVAEQYPDLKANQNFRDLQIELAGTENRISVERQRYNESLRDYNASVRGFPNNLVASFTGFHPRKGYFEAAAVAKEAPKVDFSK